jgi:hypothetical protein
MLVCLAPTLRERLVLEVSVCAACWWCAEWDEFKELDYKKIYATMTKPAFVFDGEPPDSMPCLVTRWTSSAVALL